MEEDIPSLFEKEVWMKIKLPEQLEFIQIGRLPQKQSTTSLEGKTVVLTGSTSGVGYEAALCLAKAGAKIVSMVRNEEKIQRLNQELKEINGQEHDYFLADFSLLEEVRSVSKVILEKYQHIDILINNVGVHMTTRKLTPDGHEMAFGVNHLASFLITSLFLRKMVKNAQSRILQINSEGHRFASVRMDDLTWSKRRYKGIKGYGASKTAQLMCTWELNELLKNSGVTINAMHPGAVKSNIGHNNGKLYNWYSKNIIQPMLKSAKISGEAIYYLVSSPDMEGVSGNFYNLTNFEKPAKHALDRELGKQVFERSKELCGLDKENHYEI